MLCERRACPHRRNLIERRSANVSSGSCVTRRSRSIRLRATVREMEVGPPGSAIRSLIPSHRELLRSRAVVVSVTETSGR
jgi:hypothetical protein